MYRSALIAILLSVATAAGASSQSTTAVVVDRDVSVVAGATIATGIADIVARAEDLVVPPRLFEERGTPRRTANVAYRLLKLLSFDLPQEQWLLVANHEVSGHGGTLRDRFDSRVSYRIDAPVPYGRGGGATSFEFERDPSAGELLAITTGGMEASLVAADLVSEGAFARGRMHVREALRYLGFELDPITYILGTDDEGEEAGHDVFEFLQTYNEVASRTGRAPLGARRLRREALAAFANPMLGVALYGIGRYVWSGANEVGVPTIPIGGVRYLPRLRYRLTAFGTEWALANDLRGPLRTTRVEVRFGRAHAGTAWGVSATRRELVTWRTWTIGLAAHVWRQPDVLGTSTDLVGRLRPGGGVVARAERPLIPLWFGARRATVIVEAGAKSAGVVAGEPLGRALIVRGGIGILH